VIAVGTLLQLMEATFRFLPCKPQNWGNDQGSDPSFAYLDTKSRTTLRSLGMIANAKKESRTKGRSESRQDSWDSWFARKARLRSDLIAIVEYNIFAHLQQSAKRCQLCSTKARRRIPRVEAIHDGSAACKERYSMFPTVRKRQAFRTTMISVSVQKIYRDRRLT
jgi:hypothetical protein